MASRLIDKLLVNPNVPADIKEQLLVVPAIHAQNIVNYVHSIVEAKSDRNGEFAIDDLFQGMAKIVPSFPKIFIEFGLRNSNAGVLLNYPVDEIIKYPLGVKSGISGFIIVDEPVPLYGHLAIFINDDDSLYNDIDVNPQFELSDFYKGRIKPYQIHAAYTSLEKIAVIVCWTLAFMNCKNAVLEPVEPNAKINKRRVKHNLRPLMRYHVLKIKPFGGRSDNESQGGTHGSPALHIRRGHFATYTDAAPLFGKYVGTYWKDQMLVGRKSDRVVVKDYEMDLTGVDS